MDDTLYKILHSVAQAFGTPMAADSMSIAQATVKNAASYEAQVQQDERAVNEGKAFLQHNISGAQTSDELLAAGEPGLRFFELFIPVYNDWTFSQLDFQTNILKPYRKLRRMSFSAFREDGRNLQTAADRLSGVHGDLHRQFRGLIEHWHGDAAKAAGAHVEKFLQKAKSVPQAIARVGEWSAGNAGVMEGIIRSAASMAAGLYSPVCGGHAPFAVNDMIKTLRGKSDSPMLNVISMAMDVGGGAAKSASGMGGPAGQAAGVGIDLSLGLLTYLKKCLNEEFKPAFEGKYKKFQDEIIAGTTKNLETVWSEFDALAGKVSTDPFGDLTLIVPRP
ncbi:hypothetical protein M8C13_08845 [Crossiella sp. SN42]|uniref:WXG100 family type VII secretion target n=1 Tax=Crossiella sp. SN42 TaxID=2944808 RepID=UPI00207C2D6E|nr:hypothetical protein [Crossiella sp. SN42]MCO1575863.1 hypothetical protein [Crossiella sp. SN42]